MWGWLRTALEWVVPGLRKVSDVADTVSDCAEELADHAEWTQVLLPEDEAGPGASIPTPVGPGASTQK